MESTIGGKLKTAREKKGYSLDDVYAQIRIHVSTLRALEENRFQDLPAAIYTKSFIRHYAAFLDLGADELLAEYDGLKIPHKEQSLVVQSRQNRMTTTSLFPDLALPKNISLEKTREWLKPRKKVLIVILASLVAILAAGRIISGCSGGDAPLSIEGLMKPEETARDRQAELVKIVQQTSPYIRSVGQGNFPRIGPKDPLFLKIKASTAVWLRVAADGDIVFESILRPGQFKQWQAGRFFDLQMGRPEGVTLAVNNFYLGSPDNSKRIKISRKGVLRVK